MQNQINIVLKEACEQGLAQGVYAGVSAAVSVIKKKVRYRGAFSGGVTRYDQLGTKVKPSTLFDLASLTKPLCTTLCTLALFTSGKMDWQKANLSLLEVDLPLDKFGITVLDILHHSSGLPAYRPYFMAFEPHASKDHKLPLRRRIFDEPLAYPSGSACLYSDLGFILLGQLIEKITQQSLDQFYRQQIIEPLHLPESLMFLPVNGLSTKEKSGIAATENCPWRHTVIQGEVHDEHCWLMGGIAGHAGLFGTADGVLRLGECLMDCWQGRGSHPAFSAQLLRTALNWHQPGESWRLGFDSPSPGQSSSGRYFSPQSIGHLGFTGTSFWMDPERNIIVVLLTNRVHPSRKNTKIREFRPFFHDFVMERMGMVR